MALGVGWSATLAPRTAFLGWLLGGFVASGLVGVFTLEDTRKKADLLYARSAVVPVVRSAVLVVALAAVSVSSWRYADWAAR